MAVTQFNLVSGSASVDREGFRTYVLKYQAITDNKNDGPDVILDDSSLPIYGDVYRFGQTTDDGSHREQIEIRPADETATGKKYWVFVTFSNKPVEKPDQAAFSGGKGTNDPTSVIKFGGSFIPFAELVTKDRDGNPVTNAANELFPDLFKDCNRPTLKIQRTYTKPQFITLAPTLFKETEIGTLNSAQWWYFGKDKWKLSGAPWKPAWHGQVQFVTVDYVFELKQDGWQSQPANVGAQYLESSTQKKRFVDDFGLDYGGTGFGPLESDGTKRDTDADPAVLYYDGGAASAGNPFNVYLSRDFTATPYLLPNGI